MDDIEREAKSYDNSKKFPKAGKELAETRVGSAKHEEKLKALIGLLDPDTEARDKS